MGVVSRDLGLEGLALFFFLAFPVAGALIVWSKWRKSVARKEEIRRLLVLAKEEAAWAEREASSCYKEFSPRRQLQPRENWCAVCYCPTTTRCSQCKAVRYCSGKCQIIHWRQGHKEECQPPNYVSEFGWDVDDNGKDGYDGDNTINEVGHPSDSTLADQNVVSLAEAADNTSSDDACGCESICSNESGGSDEHLSDVNARDLLGSCSDEQMDEARSSSRAFPCLINAVDIISGSLNESSETIPHGGDDSNKGLTVDPPTKIPTFLSNLVSDEKEESSDDHFQSHSLFDSQIRNPSNSRSHLQFAFSVVESDTSSLLTKHLQNKSIENHDVLSHKSVIDQVNISRRVTIFKYEKSGCFGDEDIKLPNLPKRREDGSTFLSAREDGLNEDSLKFSSSGSGLPVLPLKVESATEENMDIAVSSRLSNCTRTSGDNFKACDDSVIYRQTGSSLSKHELSGQGIDKVGRYYEKEIFLYDDFVKLYSWKEVELLPCGFMNCGNSCYANAVLQCLAFTPPLTAYFLQGLHSKICAKKDWCFMCEFERLILKEKEGVSPISPTGIVSQLRNIGSQLINGRQEDAYEFLRYVIDTMQSIGLANFGGKSTSWEEETTLVGLTFGGYLRSKIRCTKCQSKSERQDRMMDLTVQIEGDIGSLEEALHRFTETETLDGENKYQCGCCKSYEKARKKLTVLEAPNVLTITLKRFQFGRYGKLNKPITFPEILNLAPYMSGTSDKLSVYRLYGVIVHLDVMNETFSGHYVCYVKNPRNKWFKIDDCMVTPVELASVLRVGAYMLLYARCSPRAPRSIRNAMASTDLRHKAGPTKTNRRLSTLNIKPIDRLPSDIHSVSSASEGSGSIEAFHPKLRCLERFTDEDSSCDNSSLFSGNSDEGSCSTNSTRDSASVDDLCDYRFGEGMSIPWRTYDSDTSSLTSSSPSPSRQSPILRHPVGERRVVSLSSDAMKLTSSNSTGSSVPRESELERLTRIGIFLDVKSGASLGKSALGDNSSQEN